MANRTGDAIYTKQEILQFFKKKERERKITWDVVVTAVFQKYNPTVPSFKEEGAGFRSHDSINTNDKDRERGRERTDGCCSFISYMNPAKADLILRRFHQIPQKSD